MAKDAVATMGEILPPDVGGRDAVHVAVISVTAACKMFPGQHVGFLKEAVEDGRVAFVDEPVGIVDPYLEEPLKIGQRFWLYLYPRTITSLRHNWTHPSFKEDVKVVANSVYNPLSKVIDSEQWLRDFCERSNCPDYETVMRLIKEGEFDDGNYEPGSQRYDEEYLHFGGLDAHGEIPPEFWDHVEVVLGKRVNKRPSYFSCSC